MIGRKTVVYYVYSSREYGMQTSRGSLEFVTEDKDKADKYRSECWGYVDAYDVVEIDGKFWRLVTEKIT